MNKKIFVIYCVLGKANNTIKNSQRKCTLCKNQQSNLNLLEEMPHCLFLLALQCKIV